MEDVPAGSASTPPSAPLGSPLPPPGPTIEPMLPVASRPTEPPLASLGDRLVAQLVDGLIGAGLFFFLGMLFSAQLGGARPDGFQLEGIPAALLLSAVLLGTFVYFVTFELAFGATLGKLVAGVRVRTTLGSRLSLGAAAVRNLLRLIDGIGFYLVGGIVALVTRRHQRLGDLAAGTIVIHRDWPRALRAIALFLALAAAVAGVVGGFLLRPASEPPVPRFATVVLTDDRNVAVNKDLFSPTTSVFYVLFTLADVPSDTALKVMWTAEQVQGEQPELKIDEAVVVAGGQRTSGEFSLARSSFSWPAGSYRADLFIGPRLAHTIRFRVEAPPSAGGAGASPQPSASPVPNGTSAVR